MITEEVKVFDEPTFFGAKTKIFPSFDLILVMTTVPAFRPVRVANTGLPMFTETEADEPLTLAEAAPDVEDEVAK